MSEKSIPHPSVFVEARRLELIKGYRVHESRTPAKPVRVVTPSQTVGPFYPPALIHPGDDDLSRKVPGGARAQGTPIVFSGQVFDEAGKPVRGALVEVWQANKWGKYEHPADQTPEPLLAPPAGCGWDVVWSSEDRKYGGEGFSAVETVDGWRLMGEAAAVLAPVPLPGELDRAAKRARVAERSADRKRRERTRLEG